jgi:hypothetical protein
VGLKLDDVWARREAVQQARRRPDAAILPLFGEPFMPNHVDPLYLATQERVVRTFGIDRLFAAPGQESAAPTAPRMAGPRGHPSEAERAETAPEAGAGPAPARAGNDVAVLAPTSPRQPIWRALRPGRRRPRPPGAVAVITYVTRPTPWWRLPLRAWHFLRLGGPRRLQREVGNYVRWLRARH